MVLLTVAFALTLRPNRFEKTDTVIVDELVGAHPTSLVRNVMPKVAV